jgi:hypothetical protein
MPNIMIRCPIFGKDVPTGLSTESVVFDSLGDISIPLRCPACLKVHVWNRKDAWVDKAAGESEKRDRNTRPAKVSPEQRREIARKAALKRWYKHI